MAWLVKEEEAVGPGKCFLAGAAVESLTFGS